jgi:hypothetical protein
LDEQAGGRGTVNPAGPATFDVEDGRQQTEGTSDNLLASRTATVEQPQPEPEPEPAVRVCEGCFDDLPASTAGNYCQNCA